MQQQQRRPLAADAGEDAARSGVDPFGRISGKQIGKIGHGTLLLGGLLLQTLFAVAAGRNAGLCHPSSPTNSNKARGNHPWRSISRFRPRPRRSARRSASGCRTSASPPRRNSTPAARRGAGRAARQGPRAGPVVPVHPEGVWRHGPRPAGQRAGADGAGRELPGRAVDEHPGPGRRHHADAARARHGVPEGEVPQAAARTARSASATR